MLGLVLVLLLLWLGAAVVGAVVQGMFWLTLVGLALILITGAAGVSLRPPPMDDGPSPA